MVVNPSASGDWVACICVNTQHRIYTEMIGVVGACPNVVQYFPVVPVAAGKVMPNVCPLRQKIFEIVSGRHFLPRLHRIGMNIISDTAGAMNSQTTTIRKKSRKFVRISWRDQVLTNAMPLGTLEFPLQPRVHAQQTVTGRHNS